MLQRALILILLLCELCCEVQSQNSFWQRIDGFDGMLTAQVFVGSTGTLFASRGTADNPRGFYRSTNEGEQWQFVELYNPGRFTITPSDGSLWATGGPCSRSVDDGLTWSSQAILNDPGGAYCIIEYPNGDLFAGGKYCYHCGATIIWRSTDRGIYWNEVMAGFDIPATFHIQAMIVAPDGAILAAGGPDPGMWRSADTSRTWTYLPNIPARVLEFQLRAETGELFAGTDSAGLFRSTDNGLTWDSINDGLGNQTIHSVLLNPTDSTEIFVGTDDGIYYSNTNGLMWKRRTGDLLWQKYYSIARGKSGALFAGTIRGVYKSTDNGFTWQLSSQGMSGLFPGRPIQHPKTGELVLEVSSGEWSAFHSSTSQGEDWNELGAEQRSVNVNACCPLLIDANGDLLYGLWDGVHRSSDGGRSWEVIPSARTPQAIDTSHNIWYGMGDGHGAIYRSTDEGLSWQQITQKEGIWAWDEIHVLTDGTVIASYSDNCCDPDSVFMSTDLGETWVLTPLPIRGYHIKDNRRGVIFAAGTGKVYRSTDHGRSWLVALDVPGWYLTTHRRGDVFVFGSGQCYRSTDDGLSWDLIPLPPILLGTALVDDEGYLYIVGGDTSGNGTSHFYRSTQSTLTGVTGDSEPMPQAFSLYQNYPNPFNPFTVIRYQLPVTSDISLKIFNLLGEEVATLVNERKEPGSYQVRWDGSKQPSGVYFYTLQAGTFRETKKLLLVR